MDRFGRAGAIGGTGRLTRRQLVRRGGTAAVGLAALALLAACRGQVPPTPLPEAIPEPVAPTPEPPPTPTPPIYGGVRLRLLTSGDTIPAADEQLRALVAEWGRQTGAEILVETVSQAALQGRLAATAASELATNAPDIIQCRDNLAWLYADRFADLSAPAEQLATAHGGFYDAPTAQARVAGVWRALPFSVAPSAVIYRTDWLKAAGAATFPATTDELLAVGTKLKAAGQPFGAAAGRSVEDPRALWYPVLWAFGGREVEADGKTVAINSPATVAALAWAAQFWRAACNSDGLNWDDNTNNRLYAASEIAATLNRPGIYHQLQRELPDLAAQSAHAPFPQGPGGQGGLVTTYAHAILANSPRADAAKALLLWLGQREQMERYLAAAAGTLVGALAGLEDGPLWAQQPALRGLLAAARLGRWPGWPGPPGRAASESANRFVVVDLFANVLAGQPAQAALAEAETALRGIFL